MVSLVRPDGWAAGWTVGWATHYESGTYRDLTRTEVKAVRRILVRQYSGLWLNVETYR
jgi:hypothetical protein